MSQLIFFLYVSTATLAGGFLESIASAKKAFCQLDASGSDLYFCKNVPSVVDQAIAFVNNWQTLVAGGIAFFPAAIAVFFVWRQSNDQRRQFLQLHRQEAQKARLRLGGNLSRISQSLDTFFDKTLAENFSYDQHHFSSEVIESVLNVASLTSGKTFANIRDFVALTQQYTSKCALYSTHPSQTLLAKIYRDLAILDIMVDNMYPFARFEEEEIEVAKTSSKFVMQQLSVNLCRNKNIKGTKLESLLSDEENFRSSNLFVNR